MEGNSIRSMGGAALALLLLAGLLVACSAATGGDEPGEAQVDEVDVLILESFPVQVEVLIQGNLPDGCTEIEQLEQRFDADESTFYVDVVTVRSADDVCTQALVPFEERVALDVYGLRAGSYIVRVNGARETFALDVDNVPPDAELPNPASAHCEDQGYVVEIRSDEQGNQYGFCVFPDGSECDEWAFFRGDCGPDE